jgi:DNA-binding transcriptional LysR family regulator
MVRDELSVMSAFLAVADERSFTKAAKRLGVTQSALSHAIRGLEEQVGVRLLARTTRSVAPTEAGEQLLAELRPALTGIRSALDRIGGLRDTPRGRLRLLIPRLAAMIVLGPKLAKFTRNYPEVVLDVSTDETSLDLVAAGFDAGVQYGEFIQRTWWPYACPRITVPLSSAHRRTLPHTRSPRRLATSSSIAASTIVMVQGTCTSGSWIRAMSRWSSPSTGLSSQMTSGS